MATKRDEQRRDSSHDYPMRPCPGLIQHINLNCLVVLISEVKSEELRAAGTSHKDAYAADALGLWPKRLEAQLESISLKGSVGG